MVPLEIRPETIQFLLERQHIPTVLYGNVDFGIRGVRLLRSKALAEGMLYVTVGGSLRTVSQNVRCCILSACDDSVDVIELLERVNDIIDDLRTWDYDLANALANAAGIGDLLELGERFFPYPFALFDMNALFMAVSSEYRSDIQKRFGDDGSKVDFGAHNLPVEVAVNLFEDEEFLEANRNQDPFYYEITDSGQRFKGFCLNMFSAEAYMGRLVVSVPPECNRLHKGAELIAQAFALYVSAWLSANFGLEGIVTSQGDSKHELFRSIFYRGNAITAAQITKTLASNDWPVESSFTVVKFVFFEAVSWTSVALFVCMQLEHDMKGSCAIYEGNSIIWVYANISSDCHQKESIANKTVESITRTYACKAGMSVACNDLSKLAACYLEAVSALRLGQMAHPHLWRYRFEDYVLDFIVDCAQEQIPIEHLASSKLLALMQLDEHTGTEYVKVLKCFIRNGQNATHAASELFMHRTSLIRTIKRIQELVGLDFADRDELLRIDLSFKLLEWRFSTKGGLPNSSC